MSSYFDLFDAQVMLKDYPLGDALLAGPAQMSRDQLRSLQNQRFMRVMDRAWSVPFYRRLWTEKGIEPGDVSSLDDIAKLPTFSKSNLMASVERDPPFGDYHGIDFSKSSQRPNVVFQMTSGTTGRPQPLFFGARDREIQNILAARTYRFQGLQDSDVVHSVYGFGMVNGGHYIREAILHFTKAILLTAGTGLETRSEQQVSLMKDFGVTVVVGFVDYIKKLSEVAREKGLEPGRDIPVRLILGHMGQEGRNQISEAWGGARVLDWYGVGDTGCVAAEGPEQNGLYIWEDAHYFEVIDAESHDPVSDGEMGNICITCLFKEDVYPIIRFNTNDVTRVMPGAGEARIGFRRIEGFRGRSDNMVKLRGINVYPTSVGVALLHHPKVTGEYVCQVERDQSRDVMTVTVEVKGEGDRNQETRQDLADLLRQALGVQVEVEVVLAGETAVLTQIESRQKPIRLIDRRFG